MKSKETTAVIGEGITEQYYILSLKDVLNCSLEPQIPKNSSLRDLERRIELCIDNGYTNVYCLIDMDNKQSGKNKTEYINLKSKYHNKKIKNPFKLKTSIYFIENYPCTELWFYYYFRLTMGQFCSYDTRSPQIKPLLLKYVPEYVKKGTFFKNSKGLHQFFEQKGGSLTFACDNAKKSVVNKISGNAFSEMHSLIEKLRRK